MKITELEGMIPLEDAVNALIDGKTDEAQVSFIERLQALVDEVEEKAKSEFENEVHLRIFGVRQKPDNARRALREVRGKWPGDEPIEDILNTLNRGVKC